MSHWRSLHSLLEEYKTISGSFSRPTKLAPCDAVETRRRRCAQERPLLLLYHRYHSCYCLAHLQTATSGTVYYPRPPPLALLPRPGAHRGCRRRGQREMILFIWAIYCNISRRTLVPDHRHRNLNTFGERTQTRVLCFIAELNL